MTILCENIKCEHCRKSPFYGHICFANNSFYSGLQISLNKSGNVSHTKRYY